MKCESLVIASSFDYTTPIDIDRVVFTFRTYHHYLVIIFDRYDRSAILTIEVKTKSFSAQ